MAPSPLSDKAKKILDENILSENEINNILMFGHDQNVKEITFNQGAAEYRITSLASAKNLNQTI
ncbi:hypothetical protein BH11BAC7_BH11BAC7_12730 [soil metagenome]